MNASADKFSSHPAENILLIRLKSIGDVMFTLPAVHAVRANFPDAKITFLTSKENAALLRGFRDVDEIIALDRAALRSGNPFKVSSEFFGLLKKLRAGKFAVVVDFQGYGETAWLTRLTGAPQRWGSVYHTGRKWAYTHGLERNTKIHPADWNLSLLQQCGLKTGKIKNEFVLPPDALTAARQILAENKIDAAKPILFIQPLTSSPQKNWPLDKFLEVARHFQSRGFQIIFGGGPADRAFLQPVVAGKFCLAAGTPLLVSAGLVKLSSVLLGGDTGLTHLAVAMHRRVVMIIRGNTPGHCVPFQHRDYAVVPPAPGQIFEISTEAIIAATESALKNTLSKHADNAFC